MSLNQTDIKKIRRSGIIGSIIFLVIASLHLFKGHIKFSIFLYVLSAFFFVMAVFSPEALKKITTAVGEFITGLLLAIIFYLVITPIGLIMRLFGENPLQKNIEKGRLSYWVKKEEQPEGSGRFEKQF